ncbi:MAG: hypothetical protein LIO79_09835 [Rikenellaceae bacterium]|nr:hypothetical protein [Rikenellaceae bacterium]
MLSQLAHLLSLGNLWNLSVVVGGILITATFAWLYKRTQSRQLLTSLPGFWTSLGIFCTFAAICISLDGLNIENPEIRVGQTVSEIKSSGNNIDINGIITSMIPAFSTSIWGIIGALLCTIGAKIIFAKEDKEEAANLCKSPEEYIKATSITLETLCQIVKGQQSSLEQIICIGKEHKESLTYIIHTPELEQHLPVRA